MLPAHYTKQLPSISLLNFHLSQSDNGHSNGTALWLGAQCLSAYLLLYHSPAQYAIELGSGIGLSALVLSALGYTRVYATDTEHIISTVLASNIQSNPTPNCQILVRELDWRVSPASWSWNHHRVIASLSHQPPASPLSHPFDLIITSDTIYEQSLVDPLLCTLHALSTQSLAHKPKLPLILLCLERRDPLFVDSVLAQARDKWHFSTIRVPHRKLAKAIQKYALDWSLHRDDWQGIEIWKLQLIINPGESASESCQTHVATAQVSK